MLKSNIVKTDCIYFNGNIPCKFHKKQGLVCLKCSYYKKVKERILIIKLGAAGDVIRTTPLLRVIRSKYPSAEIVWLTYFPDLVPCKYVNRILSFEFKNIVWLQMQRFDWLINLDKDDEAIALAENITGKKKNGFGMDERGKCKPFGNDAEFDKWQTGLRDDLNRANKKNYMQEIFSICGFKFKQESYILNKQVSLEWPSIDKSKLVIGLNTGCGCRWTTRLWKDDNWIKLARLFKAQGFEVILLGGKQEHEQNLSIARKAEVKYFGYFNLPEFIDLVDQCKIIVSQVTMAMHIALGLNKKVVILNNIFNRNEFYLYGKGVMLGPSLECEGCFKQKFDKNCPVPNCMDLIDPEIIFESALKLNEKK